MIGEGEKCAAESRGTEVGIKESSTWQTSEAECSALPGSQDKASPGCRSSTLLISLLCGPSTSLLSVA